MFKYVIGAYWPSGEFMVHTYHSQLQHGTEEDALYLLNYVKNTFPEFDWAIYRVSFEKLDNLS